MAGIIAKEHPNITAIRNNTAQKLLSALNAGSIEAYIDNALIVNNTANLYVFNDVKYVGDTNYSATILSAFKAIGIH